MAARLQGVALPRLGRPKTTSYFLCLSSRVEPPLGTYSRDSFSGVDICGGLLVRALFPRPASHGAFLGMAGGSAFCASKRRSVGARNSREYRTLYVMSAHLCANRLFHLSSEETAQCFVNGARRCADWDCLHVQAGGNCKLVLVGRSLSNFR